MEEKKIKMIIEAIEYLLLKHIQASRGVGFITPMAKSYVEAKKEAYREVLSIIKEVYHGEIE